MDIAKLKALKASAIKAAGMCIRCKVMFIDPNDIEKFVPSIRPRLTVLDPDEEKDRTHRVRKDGVPCGGRIALSKRQT